MGGVSISSGIQYDEADALHSRTPLRYVFFPSFFFISLLPKVFLFFSFRFFACCSDHCGHPLFSFLFFLSYFPPFISALHPGGCNASISTGARCVKTVGTCLSPHP